MPIVPFKIPLKWELLHRKIPVVITHTKYEWDVFSRFLHTSVPLGDRNSCLPSSSVGSNPMDPGPGFSFGPRSKPVWISTIQLSFLSHCFSPYFQLASSRRLINLLSSVNFHWWYTEIVIKQMISRTQNADEHYKGEEDKTSLPPPSTPLSVGRVY